MRGFFAIGFALLLASCASTPSLTPQRGVALSPLLEMQLEGTREAPVPPAVLRFQLQHPGHAPAPLVIARRSEDRALGLGHELQLSARSGFERPQDRDGDRSLAE